MNVKHLVFGFEKCQRHEGDCWRYRFKAHALTGSGSAFDTSLDSEIAKCGIATAGICCQGSGPELLADIPRLSAYIQGTLQKCSEHPELLPFRISFRDELLALRPTYGGFFETLIDSIPVERNDASRWAAYLLFTCFYEYLSASSGSYSLARVYAAWQRYNLIKGLYERSLGDGAFQNYEKALRVEFASAYRTLEALLLDEANSYGCYILWEARNQPSRSSDGQGTGSHAAVGSSRKLPHPRMRHRLRLSMFVVRDSESQPSVAPMSAPGCFESVERVGEASRDQLHLRFRRNDSGRIAIHRFISDELLPRYALRDAANLARLVRFRDPGCTGIGKILGWILTMLLTLLFLVSSLVIFGSALGLVSGSKLGWALFTVLVASILVGLAGSAALGLRNGITLSMPRLFGGIVIGYFPLFVAQEPWYLAIYASQHPRAWAIAWLAVSGLVWSYLYREAFPFVLDQIDALTRSFKVFAWATVLTVTIGLWLCLFAAPIYRQEKFDTRYVNADGQAWVAPAEPCSQTQATGSDDRLVSEGLGLCVEMPMFGGTKFPTAVLLTFAPIAMSLGIILQILWEEKSVTASVWPSENR